MKERILSTLILWTLIPLSLIFFGAHAGIILIALLSAFTQFELYQLFERMGLTPRRGLGITIGTLLILGSYYLPHPLAEAGVDAGYDLFVGGFIVLTIAIILMDMRHGRLRSFLPTLLGYILVPFLLHFLVKIVKVSELSGLTSGQAIFLAVWVVAVAKAADVGGLLIGSRFGRHRLAPEISPLKSVEGALGGIGSAMLLGLLLMLVFMPLIPETFRWWQALLFPLPIALAAIASDLVESAFKRQAKVKDSGKLIPGIGGAFDLSDSLLLSAPVAFLLLQCSVFL
jgi:phosphatidate cytidylyltransferase